jgi:hypothetical protein
MGICNCIEFDRLLLEAITEVLRESLGDLNAQIVFQYLERRSCPASEIPKNLDFFSNELRGLFGCDRGKMLGSAAILERAFAEALCLKIGVGYSEEGPFVFSNFIEKLKESCINGRKDKR